MPYQEGSELSETCLKSVYIYSCPAGHFSHTPPCSPKCAAFSKELQKSEVSTAHHGVIAARRKLAQGNANLVYTSQPPVQYATQCAKTPTTSKLWKCGVQPSQQFWSSMVPKLMREANTESATCNPLSKSGTQRCQNSCEKHIWKLRRASLSAISDT